VRSHVRTPPLDAQVGYHFGLGEAAARRGKRLRPRLVLAAAASLHAPLESALPACAAIELLHNYSLVHDDIEDGDRLRHGRETLWTKYGLAHGVNAGDAIGALAYLALHEAPAGVPIIHAMTAELAQAHVRMCEGQARDLAMEGAPPLSIDDYFAMIEGKTVALFVCAAKLGARSAVGAGDADVARCGEVARSFGLGFQIQDDVEGIWGSSERTGKADGGDVARRKQTFPIVWAMQHDPEGAGSLLRKAYGPQGDVVAADISYREEVRGTLERCGARDAAQRSAAGYFDRALDRADGFAPLREYVRAWRTPSA
jgi:geranylgeranyl diphosphate synthase, type I